MKTLQNILQDIDNLSPNIEVVVIDLFCGAGGFSWGVEQATINGRKVAKVLVCVNHDALAIESHYSNMPDALHFVEDIRTVGLLPIMQIVERVRELHRHIRVMLHASLECTNHSKAKGGMSRDADSRTLAEHLFRYIEALKPDYISIENVEEFLVWGPLITKVVKDKKTGYEYSPLDVKRDKKTKTVELRPTWIPDSAHKGEYYDKWIADVKGYGYDYSFRIMNSADYGAYTSRKRFFGMFARPGLPILYPVQTHIKNQQPQKNLFVNLRKWKAVRDVLDFSNEGTSIFDRPKPLVEATLERTYAGLVKFVAGGEKHFMYKYNSMSQRRTYVAPGIDAPCPVVSTQGRLGVASVEFLSRYNSGSPMDKNIPIDSPCGVVTTNNRFAKVKASFLSKYYSGDPKSKNISIDAPSGAITTKDSHALVSADFLSTYYGKGGNYSLERPSPTVTTKDRVSYIKPCFIDMMYGNGTPTDIKSPAATVTTNPKHQLVVCQPWVMNTNFRNIGSSVNQPSHTITANRHWHYLMNPQYQSKGGSIDTPCFTLIARMDKQPPYLITASTERKYPSFIKEVPGGLVYEIYDSDSEAMVKIKEFMALYGITDIKMRMLMIVELLRIMGFPSTYILKGSQTDQKKFIGNAVETTQARVYIEAIVSGLKLIKKVA